MTTSTRIATDTVTVQLGDAVELLEGAMTHAHPKPDLPMLNSVLVIVEEGKLTATATDRYRMIKGEIEGEGTLPASVISVPDIKRILALLKGEGKRMETLPVTISRVADMVSVSVRGNAITVTVGQGHYPPTDQYLNPTGKAEATDTVVFNPAFMADYAKIASKGSKSPVGVKLEFRGSGKPIKVEFGPNSGRKVEWNAILMPMRII